MKTEFTYRCPHHGEMTTVHAERLFTSPPAVRLTLDCGCFTDPLMGGLDDMTVCQEHGPVQVVWSSDVCPRCGAHQSVLLACGCEGAVMRIQDVGVFRTHAQIEES
jgi:hypothetical protein